MILKISKLKLSRVLLVISYEKSSEYYIYILKLLIINFIFVSNINLEQKYDILLKVFAYS